MRRLTIWRKLARFHWPLLTLMIFMAVAGVFFIFSATHNADNPMLARAAIQQVTWFAIGLGVFLFCSLVEYETIVRYGWVIFTAMMLVLVYVLLFGREVNNSRSWIGVGGFGVQPGEFAKIALICGLSWFVVRQQENRGKLWMIFAVAFIALIPFGLISLQPDFGTAAVLAPITFFILWAGGARRRYLMIPVICVVVGILGCYWVVYRANWDGSLQDVPRATSDGVLMAVLFKGKPQETEATAVAPTNIPGKPGENSPAATGARKPVIILKTYQINRIRTFFKPDLDPLGAGWTIRQSLIAVGSGGLKGKGYLKGDQNIYGFIPKDIAYNDFIFSVIAEEWGFAGGALLIACHGLVILCILGVGGRSKDLAGVVICAGFAGLWFTHFFINTGMTIKVVPITGIPLPLTSYGGTFLVSCMAGLGLVQSVWIHRRDY